MLRAAFLMVALTGASLTLGGCVVVTRPPVPPPHCSWVPAHYGVYGEYHPGHCVGG